MVEPIYSASSPWGEGDGRSPKQRASRRHNDYEPAPRTMMGQKRVGRLGLSISWATVDISGRIGDHFDNAGVP